MTDLGEGPLIDRSTAEVVEVPSSTQLTDVYSPEGMAQLGDRIRAANGHCFILVHPFYNFEEVEKIEDIQDDDKRRYTNNLKIALQKVQAHNHSSTGYTELPILIFAGHGGTNSHRTEANVKGASDELTQKISTLLEAPGNYFFILTNSNPEPLDTQRLPAPQVRELLGEQHYDDSYVPLSEDAKQFVDFMLQLRQVGLRSAVVAGENFGSQTNYFKGKYWPADKPAMSGLFKVGSHTPEWLLRDHYFQRRKGTDNARKHPLEVINPDGCVAEVVRGLAFSGIQTDLTRITYPRMLPVTSQILPDGGIRGRRSADKQ